MMHLSILWTFQFSIFRQGYRTAVTQGVTAGQQAWNMASSFLVQFKANWTRCGVIIILTHHFIGHVIPTNAFLKQNFMLLCIYKTFVLLSKNGRHYTERPTYKWNEKQYM